MNSRTDRENKTHFVVSKQLLQNNLCFIRSENPKAISPLPKSPSSSFLQISLSFHKLPFLSRFTAPLYQLLLFSFWILHLLLSSFPQLNPSVRIGFADLPLFQFPQHVLEANFPFYFLSCGINFRQREFLIGRASR